MTMSQVLVPYVATMVKSSVGRIVAVHAMLNKITVDEGHAQEF